MIGKKIIAVVLAAILFSGSVSSIALAEAEEGVLSVLSETEGIELPIDELADTQKVEEQSASTEEPTEAPTEEPIVEPTAVPEVDEDIFYEG